MGDPWEEEHRKKHKKKKRNREDAMLGIFADLSSDDEGHNFSAPLSFVKGVTMDEKNMSGPAETTQLKDNGLNPAKKRKVNPLSSNEKIGEWEKYEKGIGSKLMKMMGYKGGGLGKEGQGIQKPIEVAVRPRNAGLQFNNQPERTQQSLNDFGDLPDVAVQDIEEEDDFMVDVGTFRVKKTKVTYKTAQPVTYKDKILDMRGPEQKVLNSIEDTITVTKKPMLLPELNYNINIIVDSKEAAMQSYTQKANYETENINRLEKERTSYERQLRDEESQIETLEKVLWLIETYSQKVKKSLENPDVVSADGLTLEKAHDLFLRLQEQYTNQWIRYQLDQLAFHLVFPLIERKLAKWNPLQYPSELVGSITSWKPILDSSFVAEKQIMLRKQQREISRNHSSPLTVLDDDEEDYQDNEFVRAARDPDRVNVYNQFFHSIFLSRMHHCFMNEWYPRDYVKGVKLITTWIPFIPTEVKDFILENCVMTQLKKEVALWNPQTDTQNIADWLHPWIHILGKRMEVLWNPIKAKLAQVLTRWQPSDQSALIILSPWKDVFSQNEFITFISRTILPKLEDTLKAWEVNPAKQDINTWNNVVQWSKLFPESSFVTLLSMHFFPKWFAVLDCWLRGNPNFEEISMWYINWKKAIPENLVKNPTIVMQLNLALEKMQNFMDPSSAVTPAPRVPPAQVKPSVAIQARVPTAPRVLRNADIPTTITLKESLEKLAEEHNILFMPTKKVHDGKPVYKFGATLIIIDKEIISCFDNGKWRLVGVKELLTISKKK